MQQKNNPKTKNNNQMKQLILPTRRRIRPSRIAIQNSKTELSGEININKTQYLGRKQNRCESSKKQNNVNNIDYDHTHQNTSIRNRSRNNLNTNRKYQSNTEFKPYSKSDRDKAKVQQAFKELIEIVNLNFKNLSTLLYSTNGAIELKRKTEKQPQISPTHSNTQISKNHIFSDYQVIMKYDIKEERVSTNQTEPFMKNIHQQAQQQQEKEVNFSIEQGPNILQKKLVFEENIINVHQREEKEQSKCTSQQHNERQQQNGKAVNIELPRKNYLLQGLNQRKQGSIKEDRGLMEIEAIP